MPGLLPGADCNSDHQMLTAQLQMRLKKIPQPPTPLRLNFSTLDEDYKIKGALLFKN